MRWEESGAGRGGRTRQHLKGQKPQNSSCSQPEVWGPNSSPRKPHLGGAQSTGFRGGRGGVCQEQYCRQWLRVPRGRSDQGWAGEQDEICNQQAGDLHMGTSPQTPSSQDGLEEESRKAESLPHASGLLHPHPCTGGTPQEEQVASATVNFHVHVRELWIPSEGPLSRASPEGSRRSKAEKQRDRPDGPKAPSQSVGPGSLQHRLPSGSSVVSSLSLTITEFCPSLHA